LFKKKKKGTCLKSEALKSAKQHLSYWHFDFILTLICVCIQRWITTRSAESENSLQTFYGVLVLDPANTFIEGNNFMLIERLNSAPSEAVDKSAADLNRATDGSASLAVTNYC